MKLTSTRTLFLAATTSLVLLTGACSSDSDSGTLQTTSSATSSTDATASSSCPTGTPDPSATPEWTLAGDTGSIAVTGSTDTAAPAVDVEAPFSVAETRGAPVEFPLTGVVAGFQKAIAGQTVGSTVAVAVTSADGYATGNPAAGIEQGDSLIFAISILSAS